MTLHLGEKLESIEQVGGAVQLRFHGHEAPITASVVVGADGYQSKVRGRL